ncbi:threonine/serine exporter family protein [Lederbergia lenta]|uniref:Integral membrane protein n=1 Tax=Lederbergia lenta TaxID=1467 RepID=A0A2X4VXH2_LEDLE|nr:threonine/serine exporter family protein [Lederbergia lenta]MCM3112541.1 threonine/serine exporter family protein [Lederbergia lenta]MEC2323577.1 threonine/serine exporter family protein [Lederbergia lenta]SQI52578.1 integral membrane protein [Lederbergia lenta]
MDKILIHALLSFIATAGFGIIFNAPKKSLIQCGLVGMIGWMVYWSMLNVSYDVAIAAFSGAFAVALIGHVMAKRYKMPIIIFIVAGIIPLVPGGSAYDAMRHVVSNDYSGAIPLATKAFIVSGAIAMGLVFAEVLVQSTMKLIRLPK